MFRDNSMSEKVILKFIQEHKSTHLRYSKLKKYYEGDNDILTRVLKDIDRPNNKVTHRFGGYITDLLVGYFMGEPVAYGFTDKDNVDFKELKAVLTYNIEHDENMELATTASIYGEAYEVLYVADDGNVEFKTIEPNEIFLVHDGTIKANVNYGVRYVKMNDGYTVEVYSQEAILTYKAEESLTSMTLIDTVEHKFGDVPIIKFSNNKSNIGDFEKQIPLIDAYDKFVSDSLNDFDYFTNAYLAFYGVDNPDEDVSEMKQERLLFFPEGSKAEFITKDLHGVEVENHLIRVEKDIHKLAKVPNANDENFANNSSGVAMQYKLLGTENLAIAKERRFTKGLQKRIELIINFLNFKGNNNLSWREVNITFTRNLPTDLDSTADYINKLRGLISDTTLISWLPNINDPEKEIEKRNNENSEPDLYNFIE